MSQALDPAALLQQALATVTIGPAEEGLRSRLRSLLPALNRPLVVRYSEAEAVIVLGHICSKRYDQSLSDYFIEFLPLLESFSFHGIKLQQDLTKDYIHRYTLAFAQLRNSNPQARKKAEVVLSAYLQSAFDTLYSTLVTQTKGRNAGVHAFQRTCVLREISKQRIISKNDAEFLLEKVTSLYLHAKLIPCKLTNIHLYVMKLLENILWTGEDLLETRNSEVSETFESALALIKKFTKGKHHSEKLVKAAVCTVFCCLSSKGVEDVGLHYVRASNKSGSIALRSLSHNSGLEFFIDYFISKQFTPDKNVDLGRKLLKAEIPYVARYLKYYPERKSEFLVFLHGLHVDLVTKWGIKTDKIEELLANATTTLIMDELSATNDFNNSLALPYIHEQALESLNLIPFTIISILGEIVHRNSVQTIETQIINSVLSRLESVDDKAVYIQFVQNLLKVVKFEETFRSLMQLLLREFRKDPVMAAVAGNFYVDQDIEDLMPRFPLVSFSLMLNFIVEVLLEHICTLTSDVPKGREIESIVSSQVNNAIVFMVQAKADMTRLDSRLLGRLRLFWEVIEFFLVNFKGYIGASFIKQLGEITPILLDPKSTSSTLHLNTCAVFSSERMQNTLARTARERLQEMVRGVSIGYMEYEEMMFCLAVSTILTNKERPLSSCLDYLEDESLLKTRSLFEVIKRLVVTCIEQYVQTLAARTKNEARELAIVDDLTLLLKRACSKVVTIRLVAQELLCLYISRRQTGSVCGMNLKTCYSYMFPYLLGNLRVVQVALDLLGCLHMELNRQYDSLVHTVTLPHSKDSIVFPANREEKEDIMAFFRTSLSEMLGKAISINMTEVMTSFASYTFTSNELLKSALLREESQTVSTITNFGISFFNQVHYSLKLALEQSEVDLRMAYFDPAAFHAWFTSKTSAVQSVGLSPASPSSQSAASGLAALLPNENQLTIMNINYFTTVSSKRYLDLLETASPQKAFLSLERELFDTMTEQGDGVRRDWDIATSSAFDRMKSSTIVSNSKLFDILGKLAMLYIMEQRSGATKHLATAQLHTLVWAGVINMTYTSVAATIYCWDLVCSSVPMSAEFIFLEILNVWRYVAYRGGIVVPGAISAPRPKERQVSNLFTSQGFRDLNSHFGSTQDSFLLPREGSEFSLSFQSLAMKHLLEIQEGLLDFISHRFYPFLARNNQSLKYVIRLVFETVSLPVNTCAIREKRGMQVCLKLFLLAIQSLTGYSTAGDAFLPTHTVFRDRALKFMLRAFSSSYTWRHVGHRQKLESELALLQKARSVCLDDTIDVALQIGRYSVWNRPRPATTDVEHSGCNLLYERRDGSVAVDRKNLRQMLASKADTSMGRFGLDVPSGSPKDLKSMRILLHLLLSDEYERLFSWNRPILSDIISSATSVERSLLRDSEALAFVAWRCDPMIAFNFAKRFKYVFKHAARNTVEGMMQTLSSAVRPRQDWGILFNCSVAVQYFVQDNLETIKLIYWMPPTLPSLLPTLNHKNGIVRSYGIRQLLRSPDTAQIFYLQQILLTASPLMNRENYSRILLEEDACTYIITASSQSPFLRNHIEWVANVYLRYQEESKDHAPEDRSNALMSVILETVMSRLRLDAEKLKEHDAEVNFFDGICSLSASLKPHAPENVLKIKEGLLRMTGDSGNQVEKGIYLPTNPDAKVVGVNVNSGVTLQSAKRVPILIVFKTITSDVPQTTPCIFKVNDDVRNDQLCLQLIELMRDVFRQHKLPLYLRPYKVISNMTRVEGKDFLGGIIECIPGCKSRDEIGKEGSSSLYTYFVGKFGSEDTRDFQLARKNFIESLAAYSIASYLLQIKDRHNGNILIDSEGHLLHIDFGFILSISPAGNMRFERPDFKMTTEMTELMGNESSESFKYFQELVVRGFILIREYAPELITMVDMMKDSGYTCFRPDTMKSFRERFYIEKSLPKVANKMQSKIYWANNSIFTNWYDRIQLIQQKIEY